MFLRTRLKDVHLTSFQLNRCNYAYFIFLNNMVMFYHFQMFNFRFLFIFNFIVIGM